jgi:hypothetical protein
VRAKRSTILSCSWTSPPEFGGCPYIGKYLFSQGRWFQPGLDERFLKGEQERQACREALKVGIYVIRVSNPPVIGFMPGFNRLSLSCG